MKLADLGSSSRGRVVDTLKSTRDRSGISEAASGRSKADSASMPEGMVKSGPSMRALGGEKPLVEG